MTPDYWHNAYAASWGVVSANYAPVDSTLCALDALADAEYMAETYQTGGWRWGDGDVNDTRVEYQRK